MGRIKDIRVIKKRLRTKYRNLRMELTQSEKTDFDDKLFTNIISMQQYINAETLLCFVSTDIEVDTSRLIKQAFLDKKTVAVPKCTNKLGGMEFYIINSYSDFEESTFGLSEPRIDVCRKLDDFDKSICIIPGFAFDMNGYRIGFGKGYYDRFLNSYSGAKVGVCYDNCVAQHLPRGRYDVVAEFIVTPSKIIVINDAFK